MNTDNLATVRVLQPVDLDEVASIAELQIRTDRKYLVPLQYLEHFLSRLDARALEIRGDRTFAYESVYFDTPELVSYLGAARRRPRRFKVRTRTYAGSGECMLEVKTRDARGRTVKHRVPHPFDQRSKLTAAARAFVRTVDAAAPNSEFLDATLTTTYRRATLLLHGAPARVTVDIDTEFKTPDGRSFNLDEVAMVETKTAGPPCVADRLLWRSGYRPATVSKYGTGLAALSRNLPANEWHRVLLLHFGGAPRTVG